MARPLDLQFYELLVLGAVTTSIFKVIIFLPNMLILWRNFSAEGEIFYGIDGTNGTTGRIERVKIVIFFDARVSLLSLLSLLSLSSSLNFSASQQTKRSATQWQTFYVYCMLFYSVDFDSTATSRLTFDTKP